jgi:hypothetical protein
VRTKEGLRDGHYERANCGASERPISPKPKSKRGHPRPYASATGGAHTECGERDAVDTGWLVMTRVHPPECAKWGSSILMRQQ